jgi:hypothetical protein
MSTYNSGYLVHTIVFHRTSPLGRKEYFTGRSPYFTGVLSKFRLPSEIEQALFHWGAFVAGLSFLFFQLYAACPVECLRCEIPAKRDYFTGALVVPFNRGILCSVFFLKAEG